MHRGATVAAASAAAASAATRRSYNSKSLEEFPQRVRVHVFAFGDHLKTTPGALALVPSAPDTELDVVKAVLLRALFGAKVLLDRIDWTTVQVFLLPSGEEIRSSDIICANDTLLIYAGAVPFAGNVLDASDVAAAMNQPGYGLPNGGINEELREAVAALEHGSGSSSSRSRAHARANTHSPHSTAGHSTPPADAARAAGAGVGGLGDMQHDNHAGATHTIVTQHRAGAASAVHTIPALPLHEHAYHPAAHLPLIQEEGSGGATAGTAGAGIRLTLETQFAGQTAAWTPVASDAAVYNNSAVAARSSQHGHGGVASGSMVTAGIPVAASRIEAQPPAVHHRTNGSGLTPAMTSSTTTAHVAAASNESVRSLSVPPLHRAANLLTPVERASLQDAVPLHAPPPPAHLIDEAASDQQLLDVLLSADRYAAASERSSGAAGGNGASSGSAVLLPGVPSSSGHSSLASMPPVAPAGTLATSSLGTMRHAGMPGGGGAAAADIAAGATGLLESRNSIEDEGEDDGGGEASSTTDESRSLLLSKHTTATTASSRRRVKRSSGSAATTTRRMFSAGSSGARRVGGGFSSATAAPALTLSATTTTSRAAQRRRSMPVSSGRSSGPGSVGRRVSTGRRSPSNNNAVGEGLLTAKAEALLDRLEKLEERTRAAAENTAAAAGGDKTPGVRQPKTDAAGRRLSLIANEKLRRAVHKLVLINRFNKNGWSVISPLNDSGKLLLGSGSNMGTSLGDSRTSGVGGHKPRSRWTLAMGRAAQARSIGKTMDAYIKEQVNLYQYNELRKKTVKDDERLPWYIFKPEAIWRIGWDMMILVLVCYYSLMVPIRIGFDMTETYNETVFDYWADCTFILDIAVSFMTTYKEDGVYVNDRWKVAHTYATTWFPVDFMASVPIGWFTENLGSGSSAGGINKILRLLRLFKLFRLLRLLKLFPKLVAILEATIKIDPGIIRFLRSFLALLMMWHVMGCSYWYMVRMVYNGTAQCPDIAGRPPRTCFVNQCLCDIDLTSDVSQITVLDGTDTTFYDPFYPDQWVPFPGYANQPVANQYWWSIFWAVAATTSVGMNIVPKSQMEIIFTVVMILLGLMMYSVIIGSASSALSNLDVESMERKQTLERIIKYMRGRHVPAFFQKIIKDYYQHSWSLPQADEEVLNDLPSTLRSKLNMILNRDLVDRIPVMQCMNMDTYLKVVQRLTYGTYLPGDFIVRQGDLGDHLYFIKSGKVDAVLPNGVTVFMTLRPGDFFGEHSLLYLTRRDASFRAVDFVDVLVMSRADFTELYITAPEFVREVQRTDVEREKRRLHLELEVVKRQPKRHSKNSMRDGAAAAGTSSNTLGGGDPSVAGAAGNSNHPAGDGSASGVGLGGLGDSARSFAGAGSGGRAEGRDTTASESIRVIDLGASNRSNVLEAAINNTRGAPTSPLSLNGGSGNSTARSNQDSSRGGYDNSNSQTRALIPHGEKQPSLLSRALHAIGVPVSSSSSSSPQPHHRTAAAGVAGSSKVHPAMSLAPPPAGTGAGTGLDRHAGAGAAAPMRDATAGVSRAARSASPDAVMPDATALPLSARCAAGAAAPGRRHRASGSQGHKSAATHAGGAVGGAVAHLGHFLTSVIGGASKRSSSSGGGAKHGARSAALKKRGTSSSSHGGAVHGGGGGGGMPDDMEPVPTDPEMNSQALEFEPENTPISAGASVSSTPQVQHPYHWEDLDNTGTSESSSSDDEDAGGSGGEGSSEAVETVLPMQDHLPVLGTPSPIAKDTSSKRKTLHGLKEGALARERGGVQLPSEARQQQQQQQPQLTPPQQQAVSGTSSTAAAAGATSHAGSSAYRIRIPAATADSAASTSTASASTAGQAQPAAADVAAAAANDAAIVTILPSYVDGERAAVSSSVRQQSHSMSRAAVPAPPRFPQIAPVAASAAAASRDLQHPDAARSRPGMGVVGAATVQEAVATEGSAADDILASLDGRGATATAVHHSSGGGVSTPPSHLAFNGDAARTTTTATAASTPTAAGASSATLKQHALPAVFRGSRGLPMETGLGTAGWVAQTAQRQPLSRQQQTQAREAVGVRQSRQAVVAGLPPTTTAGASASLSHSEEASLHPGRPAALVFQQQGPAGTFLHPGDSAGLVSSSLALTGGHPGPLRESQAVQGDSGLQSLLSAVEEGNIAEDGEGSSNSAGSDMMVLANFQP